MITIDSGKIEKVYWVDLWRYRELFFFLAWRDILVRYKQTVIGVLWAVLRPLLTTAVFVMVGGRLAQLPSDGLPYAVFVYAAMLPWQFFSSALSEASNSLVGNANMLSKVYFPRLIVPTSAMIVGLVDFLISVLIMVFFIVWYQIPPTPKMFALPFLTLLTFFAAFGPSLWLAALNVKYRDFRYVIPFIVQFGLYVSPVMFGSAVVREKLGDTFAKIYCLNPMVGVIDGFRWAIGGQAEDDLGFNLLVSGVVATVMLVCGFKYFRSTEETFADVI